MTRKKTSKFQMRIDKTLLTQLKSASAEEGLSTSEWLQRNAEIIMLWLYDATPIDDNHKQYTIKLMNHLQPIKSNDNL